MSSGLIRCMQEVVSQREVILTAQDVTALKGMLGFEGLIPRVKQDLREDQLREYPYHGLNHIDAGTPNAVLRINWGEQEYFDVAPQMPHTAFAYHAWLNEKTNSEHAGRYWREGAEYSVSVPDHPRAPRLTMHMGPRTMTVRLGRGNQATQDATLEFIREMMRPYTMLLIDVGL